MKKIAIFSLFMIWGLGPLWAQDKNIYVEPQAFCSWGDLGIIYKKVPGANLGATSFLPLTANRFAYLANSTGEIVIANQQGNIQKRFSVGYAPRDFAWESPYFYVLSEKQVTVYDENGHTISSTLIPANYLGVEKILRSKQQTKLLLPNNNTLTLDSTGNKEYKGWMGADNISIKTELSDKVTFALSINGNGHSYTKTFQNRAEIAGVFVVGATHDHIILDVQMFRSQKPISIIREIVFISRKNGIGNVTSRIQLPDCYYVAMNSDIRLDNSRNLFHMIGSPEGLYIFLLSERDEAKDYPEFLKQQIYHYNNYLIRIESKP